MQAVSPLQEHSELENKWRTQWGYRDYWVDPAGESGWIVQARWRCVEGAQNQCFLDARTEIRAQMRILRVTQKTYPLE